MNLSILYRGPLSSCNYGCEYCPFAKHDESREQHEVDRRALERFIDWVEARRSDRISVLFTPWGEALIHPRYQQALVRLSQLPHVDRAVIQTNLSGRLEWVDDCDRRKLALWATYHPTEISRERFLARCLDLDRRGVRFSVGVVGLKQHLDEIAALRRELPAHLYLWVNAYKRSLEYYSQDDETFLSSIDPLFPINNQRHPSLGLPCRAGHSVISVDGDGVIRRCHFIREPLGNLYEDDLDALLYERACANETCGCHIGYVHLKPLNLYQTFDGGVLERIPARLRKRRN